MAEDITDHLARLIKDRVRLHLGPNALAQANAGSPVTLNGGEADQVAAIALEVVAVVRGAELERVSGYAKRMEEMVIERDREATQWAGWLRTAEAAISRVRDLHRIHSCEVDGHKLDRTPNPCVNDGFCSCGQRNPCPTLEALDPPEFELIELTHEEWETARDNDLAKLGCTLAELEEMVRTGDYATPGHRALWLAIKPVPPETPR